VPIIPPLFSAPFRCGHKLLNPRSLQVTSFFLFGSSPHAPNLTNLAAHVPWPHHLAADVIITTKHFRSVSCP
jgi:predicted permease